MVEAKLREKFEAWRATAPWYVTSKAFAQDDDDGASIHRMMNIAASEAWQAAAALSQPAAARDLCIRVGHEVSSWIDSNDPLPDIAAIVDAMLATKSAAQVDSSHPAGGECGGVQGAETVPSYRGYALLGIGAYIIFHSDPPDDPELVIRIADASDVEGGREIGEIRPAPKRLVYPEEMAIRIGFTSVAGLDALEEQLRSLRAEHFAGKGGAV